ncbi:MAG: AIR synthase-related protein [Blautia massiliensis (ex Durand et al. 2017)]
MCESEEILEKLRSTDRDKLILTKPLGAGIINTAIKADLVSEEARTAALASMKLLNRSACEVFREFEIHACTDITGFGLGGHAAEMAAASDRTIMIDTEKLPLLPDVEMYASMGLIPGGAYRNQEYANKTGVKKFSSALERKMWYLIHRLPVVCWQQSKEQDVPYKWKN